MKIVLDSSVLMSALLRNSISRSIIVLGLFEFYIPKKAVEEIQKYKEEIMERGNYNEQEFDFLLNGILEKVKLVENKILKSHMKKAEDIMRDIDIEDSSFIACAFAIKADGILSFDNHFLRQDSIKVFKLGELLKMI